MIGRTNAGGGGGGLNFKVVGGTSAPSSPKENTIWVNTSVAITGWVFSATAPSSPAAGLVWIPTGESSAVDFNALKKNGIQVYPVSAKQYVGGAWVDMTAKIYQGGAWKELITYLYNKGDECTDLTGGWAATAAKPSGSGSTAVSPAVTKGTDSITLSMYSGYGNYRIGYLATAKSIDLTNYSKITINVTKLSVKGEIIVSNSKTSGFSKAASMQFSVGANMLDISSLNGKYYVLLGMGGHEGTASFTFDKVYLG